MSEPLLEIQGLTLRRGGRTLCRDLDLSVETGSRWGILGPNGAGKTTLLHTLAGLIPAAAGRVLCRGRPLHAWPRRALARELGLLFQQETPALTTTVFEAVLGGRHPHLDGWGWETRDDLETAWRALSEMGLEPLARRDPQTLSGGERQRMEIAALLAQAPTVALLDEPINHLDPAHQAEVLEGLRRHFGEAPRAMVLVLHDVNLALTFCDRLLLLRGDGRWRAGAVEALGTAAQLSWVYGCEVRPCDEVAAPCFRFPTGAA